MIDNRQTIAAIATPPGKGGIGIIRLSGPLSLTILDSLGISKPTPREARFASFKNSSGQVLDQGLAIYFPGPASYTGEDVVEIHAHGGQFLLNTLLQETLRLGARHARPGEFTERAFMNGKMDLLQAESVADLVNSASFEASQGALRSLKGEFSRQINELLKSTEELRVFIEGALDFPEEEIDFLAESDIAVKLNNIVMSLETLLSQAEQGRVFNEGISLAILGPPNVGKSSLLNALSRTDRAIVTAIAGTTRDILEDSIVLDGVPLTLVDTAGLRQTGDPVEQEGIRRAEQAARQADLLLYVQDAGQPNISASLPSKLSVDGQAVLYIHNKIDLAGIKASQRENAPGKKEVFVSVKTGEGMDLLKQELKKLLGLDEGRENSPSARTRHIDALQRCHGGLQQAQHKLKQANVAVELLAEDILHAQRCLEEITGESTADDLLGKIFSSFCIGK